MEINELKELKELKDTLELDILKFCREKVWGFQQKTGTIVNDVQITIEISPVIDRSRVSLPTNVVVSLSL